jgi:hypothetical protein
VGVVDLYNFDVIIFLIYKYRDNMTNNSVDLFNTLKNSVLSIDPVFFCEKKLIIDGRSLSLKGTGYKPFADIYRYIGLKSLDKNAKPIVLVKGRQVGATTMAAALECYFCGSDLFGINNRPSMRIMHIFPTLALAASYTKDKLDSILSQSSPVPNVLKSNGMLKSFMENKLDTSSPANNNMHFKQFINGNKIWIESTGLDGDRVRGRTVDCVFMDEVQDMDALSIGTVNKTLTKSQYGPIGTGIQIYFGTPKQKGGAYWKMWQSSTQNYFHLGCEKCGEFFPLYRPDIKWEDIWIYGLTVKCPKCSCEQDKSEAQERGKWIPLNNEEECEMIGYHINQLYIPNFTRETIDKEKPDRSPINTERVYMNEVLGEFYDGEGGTITLQEIKEKCVDKKRKMLVRIPSDYGKRSYAGFDWGQKSALAQMVGKGGGGKSYSCAVILTVDGNLFNVEFATRLKHIDLDSKMDTVEEMFRRYNMHLAVGDIGDAYDLTHKLQSLYDERFLASRASHKVNSHVKYSSDEWPKTIVFEKDYYISELLGLLKEGRIKFPGGSYDRVEWLMEHCSSMEIKITKDASGEPIKKYVKGSTPNDGMMALLNAYLAYKFDITQGFVIKDPSKMRVHVATEKEDVQAVLGYMPRMRG